MTPKELSSALTGTAYNRIVQLRDEIRDAIGRMGLKASGRTQDSLKVRVDGNTVILEGRAFFPTLQYGLKPWSGSTGVRCTFDEFKAIIRDWATAKGLSFGDATTHERTIGAIAMTIIRRGSKVYRSGQRLDVYDTLIDEALLDLGEQLNLINVKAVDVVIDKWAKNN
jgi:hypothetical protein